MIIIFFITDLLIYHTRTEDKKLQDSQKELEEQKRELFDQQKEQAKMLIPKIKKQQEIMMHLNEQMQQWKSLVPQHIRERLDLKVSL